MSKDKIATDINDGSKKQSGDCKNRKDHVNEMAKTIYSFLRSDTMSRAMASLLYGEGYRKQSEWISVEDRLPDIIDTFLVVVKMKYPWEETWEYNVDVAVYQPFEEGYIEHWDTWNDWDEGRECHITHWLPLPEAPKMKGGERE